MDEEDLDPFGLPYAPAVTGRPAPPLPFDLEKHDYPYVGPLAQRIFGIEVEFGAIIDVPGTDSFVFGDGIVGPAGIALAAMNPGVVRHEFFPNGCRFYRDIGGHPEHATPECASIEDLLIWDRAGMLLAAELCERARPRVEEIHGPGARLRLFRDDTADGAINSWGTHENYMITRSVNWPKVTATLATFLATRPVIAGGGGIARNTNGTMEFRVSRRTELIFEQTSAGTTHRRPIVNTRDEAHAPNGYRRLHIVAGDSIMCDWAKFVSWGATAALLRVLEHDPDRFVGLRAFNAVDMIHAVGRDASLRELHRASAGSRTTALAMQYRFADICAAAFDDIDFPDEEQRAVHAWIETLDLLTTDRSALVGKLDWVTKEHLAYGLADRGNGSLDDPKIQVAMRRWHEVGTGIAERFRDNGTMTVLVDESSAEAATRTPPPGTRAALRSQVIAHGAAHQAPVWVADWGHFGFGLTPLPLNDEERVWFHRGIKVEDPFGANADPVTDLLAVFDRDVAAHTP